MFLLLLFFFWKSTYQWECKKKKKVHLCPCYFFLFYCYFLIIKVSTMCNIFINSSSLQWFLVWFSSLILCNCLLLYVRKKYVHFFWVTFSKGRPGLKLTPFSSHSLYTRPANEKKILSIYWKQFFSCFCKTLIFRSLVLASADNFQLKAFFFFCFVFSLFTYCFVIILNLIHCL